MQSVSHLAGRQAWLAAAAIALAGATSASAQLPATGGRIEENNPFVVSYSGTWHTLVNGRYSGISAAQTAEPGATVSVSFHGTGIRWIGLRDEWAGIAAVSIDDEFLATIDTYATPAEYQTVAYATNELPAGNHTLKIQVLDVANGASGGSAVWIDAFEVLNDGTAPPPLDPWTAAVRSEQDSTAVAFVGLWHVNESSLHSGGSASLALDDGARATLTFTGSRVRWIGFRDEWTGIARVYLDGALVGYVDGYATPAQPQAVQFRTGPLTPGPHTFAVEATHQRNASSGARWVWVDAFDVVD